MRNNTPEGHNIPTEWNIGEIDYRTGTWNPKKAKNVKWVARLGSQTYGNTGRRRRPRVHRHQQQRRLAQAVSARSRSRRACSASTSKTANSSGSTAAKKCRRAAFTIGRCRACAARRWWKAIGCGLSRTAAKSAASIPKASTTARTTVLYKSEDNENKDEADVIWVFDMMKELGVSQHNMADCSVTSAGDTLFVCTSNGVDEAHNGIPAPQRPASSRSIRTPAKVLWTDKSPGLNHPARPMVVARVWRAGRRAASDFRRRRRLALQLRSRGRRQRQLEAAVEVRLQSEDVALRSEQGDAQPHHRLRR